MRTDVDVRDLPARLEEVLALAKTGQEITVMANGAPRATLIPLVEGQSRQFDLHPGAFVVAPDFDDPLPESVWPGNG